ncbi:MAG: serine/threonine-protein kinase [Chloroflexota bacterium]
MWERATTVIAGRYRLERRVGEGGMAEVYLAHDELLDRPVAVKVLRQALAQDRVLRERFVREAQAAARLDHPHIVGVYDLGEWGGRPFLVMEWVEGPTLASLIRERGPLPTPLACELGAQIASALAYAHARGLIHRDVKPHNILLKAEGGRWKAKLGDFGLAKVLSATSLTLTQEVFGTPQYVAPEVVRGERVTPAADLYSLGVVLFEMLTGQTPFAGESPAEVAFKHLSASPPPPSKFNPQVPPSLDRLVLQLLAKNPAERPQRAGEVVTTLEAIGRLDQVPTARISTGRRPAGSAVGYRSRTVVPPRRRIGLMPFIIVFLLALAALLVAAGLFVMLKGVPAVPAATTDSAPAPTPEPTTRPPALVTVPSVVGMTPEDARVRLEGRDLKLQLAGQAHSNTVPEGRIIRQQPEAGTSVAPGTTVAVTVSLGPELVVVPRVVEWAYDEAEQILEKLGLEVEKREEFALQTPAGVVMRQDPAPGTRVLPGTRVTLVVSRGLPKVQVPNVVGERLADAMRRLEEAGLKIKWPPTEQGRADNIPPEVLNRVCVGCVLSTDPPAGREVNLGTEVKVAVRKD